MPIVITDAAKQDLTNSPYTTNRIIEIPQDIKLELNNGSLTLKAGSKVYVPNGFEADGTTPKFNVVVVNVDRTGLEWFSTNTTDYMIFYEIGGGIDGTLPERCTSGTSYPSSPSNGDRCYRTDLNRFYAYRTGSSSWVETDTLPLGIVRSSGTAGKVGSIDQVFNGFGYIGSTVFVLPGVKVLIPNGKNEDGSYKTFSVKTTSVTTASFHNTVLGGMNWYIGNFGNAAYYGSNYIKFSENNLWESTDGQDYILKGVVVATSDVTSGVISNWKPCNVDSVANSNASNFSQAGRSYLSGLSMPSNKYINLTLGANGSTYTAPANGWYTINKGGAANQLFAFENVTAGGVTWISMLSLASDCRASCPAKKGDNVRLWYTATGTTNFFRFVYAEGENNV